MDHNGFYELNIVNENTLDLNNILHLFHSTSVSQRATHLCLATGTSQSHMELPGI